jgi:CheY-like chemotaxis protein
MNGESCSARVMVVDDDTDLRETIIEVLRDNDYEVVGAANGQEALDLLHGASARPCVILLDLMMPVMDGKTFYYELMKEPELSSIPIIVLSAHAEVDAMLAEVSVVAKLRKPVDIVPLLELVGRQCRERRSSPVHSELSS